MASVEERVARGVALLDEHQPGWVDNVDLDTLNMSQYGHCVAGQQPGGYFPTVRGLGLMRRVDEVAAGFDADVMSLDGDYSALDADYSALEAEWERVILERRDGHLPPEEVVRRGPSPWTRRLTTEDVFPSEPDREEGRS